LVSDVVDSLDLATLRARYRSGAVTPVDLVAGLCDRLAARGDDKLWIHLLPRQDLLAMAEAVTRQGPIGKPLFGVPFAIKDNIDLADHPTTAACPDYRYVPARSAPVVAALVEAGAIPIGKTNLDQFATGLVGTRSPHGACPNAFNAAYISGGSSSGSAVAVAASLVSFSLGTDTAGSGRVPAAFGNIFGLKPTRGLLSGRGVVPACRSLDCISIFALTAEDAREVLRVATGYDAADPFSRIEPRDSHRKVPRDVGRCCFGVPRGADLEFFGNDDGRRLFGRLQDLIGRLGGRVVEIDFAPFRETARLLYEGPWLAERYVAIRDFIERHPTALHPVTHQIIAAGAKPTAADAFAAYYRLKELRREAEQVWDLIDVLMTPTAARPYTIAEVLADPIRLNANLGYYTNFMNLLDLSALAVPAGFQLDGLPFGVTLAAPAFQEEALCSLGAALQRSQELTLGALGHRLPPPEEPPPSARPAAEPATVRVAVCGAHMAGLPLNHQLVERGGRLVWAGLTAPLYRMFALTNFKPLRPGLIRAEPGRAIAIEVWELPAERFGSFVDGIPGPLGIGTVELDGGEQVRGFLCEPYAIAGAKDISDLGSWRRYLEQKQ
jgi:allophanate hydrolase